MKFIKVLPRTRENWCEKENKKKKEYSNNFIRYFMSFEKKNENKGERHFPCARSVM